METEVDRRGLILQDLAEWEDWRLLVGARLDRHESDEGNKATSLSPRVGVTYMIEPTFSVYGNYTRAAGPNFGSTDIDGEELTSDWVSKQVEVGVKGKLFDSLWATVAAFRIDQENTPEPDPADPTGMASVTDGENRSKGVELGLDGEVVPGWSVWGSYTYVEYEDVDDGIDFPRHPEHSLSLWTTYRFSECDLDGLRVGLGYRYTDEYATTFRGAFISRDSMIESAHVVDLSLAIPLSKLLPGCDADLELGVKNVLGRDYVESNRHGTENFPGQPRTFWLRFGFDF
jgi:iron complex outermembrane receptor protein